MGDGSINVETGGLDRFAGDVGFYAVEVDPMDVERARRSFSAGITFGQRNASVPLLRTKENYGKALANSLTNLGRFVEAAKILADAAEQAARDFRTVDDRSARDINHLLTAATERARTARDGGTTP
ncbi:hypothetical protein ACFQFC_18725 [Amorphoplanes digitatis]|uniref:Uncharacterized protein n=1 Tax=Actinoplanes digitatis TaxID=1868 RepID=A0A7W7MTC6_9ACTN|nr:hypothetical protein [Actinoplanes digitatis]MBB4766251.1 hypothetical protein [Actinoplanes digitatis]BFE76295.1 hypothetical protein GCM10020092_095960 [Actinoplanes digitatis]GID95976.1 hypothetical protein Adi01nite_53880 [Actinoplanes digitatis]